MATDDDAGSSAERPPTQPVFSVPQADGIDVALDFTTPGPFGDFAFTARIPEPDGTVRERVYGAHHTDEAAIFVEILQHWARVAEPDDILAGLERAGELAASIDTTGFVSVLDITHGRAMIRVSGPKAAKVLEKVCNVDLSDDMTPDGAVFSASVAKVTCDLLRADRGGEPSYLISCERSFGGYLYAALADACTEFGATLPAGLGIH